MKQLLRYILLLAASPAFGQGKGAAALPDPMQLPVIVVPSGRDSLCCGNEINSKTARNPTINTGIRNLVLILDGQSNVNDNHSTAYVPANPTKIDNLNLFDGQIYAATDPLLGSRNDGLSLGPGNFSLRLADNLITANKFDRVIILIVAISGAPMASLLGTPGTGRYNAAYSRLTGRGITPGLTNTTIAILFGHGEGDCAGGTTQGTYSAGLTTTIAAARAAGFTQGLVPFFVAKQSWVVGVTCAAIQNAQIGIVNHPTNIWLGPDADTLDATNRQADNIHFNATGAAAYASLWQTALAAFGAPF